MTAPGAGSTGPTPTEIRLLRAERILEIDFDDGARARLPAEFLRVESPSAEVQGHHPSQRTWIAGRRHVAISAVEPVGRYAVRLVFDDGHDTGIYSWDLLHTLGREQAQRWDIYLRVLAEKGLSRDP
jgi:DUF971 family protein